MANAYLSLSQFFSLYDQRTMLQLSGDQNSPAGSQQNVQFLLDVCASKLDSFLNGRVGLPLNPVPLFLSVLVADMAVSRLYGRRTDVPKYIQTISAQAEQWLQDFKAGGVTIPGASFTAPVLQYSDSLCGKSRFDFSFGTYPSPTSPGGNNNGGPSTGPGPYGADGPFSP